MSKLMSQPWSGVTLPKSVRKGKTAQELDEMRREKWFNFHGIDALRAAIEDGCREQWGNIPFRQKTTTSTVFVFHRDLVYAVFMLANVNNRSVQYAIKIHNYRLEGNVLCESPV